MAASSDTAGRINARLEEYLEGNGIDVRQNFRCLNSDHPDFHPSMHYMRKNNKVHCFSCGATYDLIDLIGLEYGTRDRKTAFKKACELYDCGYGSYTGLIKAKPKPEEKPEVLTDYSEFFTVAHRNLGATSYHRGLSRETLDRFNVGYMPMWRHPKSVAEGKNPPSSPRLIIPTSRYSYIARDTRSHLTEEQNRYKKQKVGKVCIFNASAIKESSRPIFVVEGEIDAMSIIDVGGEAVGLGSISNVGKLIDFIKTVRPRAELLIALDNEQSEPVRKAVAKLDFELTNWAVSHRTVNIYGDYKDANEFLMSDREGLKKAVVRYTYE